MLEQARGSDWLEDRKMKIDSARFALEETFPRRQVADAAKVLRAAETATTILQRNETQQEPHKFALIGK
jgi:hypothetical protein